MARTVERIRREVGERPAAPSRDRICGALRKLREQGAGSLDGMEFWFACWGITEQCGNQAALIKDDRHFVDFLNEAKQRKPATLAWQGLLDAYFRYTPLAGNLGKNNWLSLRGWLATDLPALRRRTSPTLLPHLNWLVTLWENQALLEDDPCRTYAAEALRGDRTRVERIKSALGITEASWFWPRLILSQVDEATGYGDAPRFKASLETLIAQLREHPTVKDAGLARLLTRYAACADRSAHEGLKRFALDTWKNPHRGTGWGNVEAPVRQMVQEWISLEDLCDFFRMLRQDGQEIDTKRLAFWMRYVGRMTRTHIVLGAHAWTTFAALRNSKPGRISRLKGSGASNNAFIMQIGNYVFVEFSHTGNAAFGYEARHMEVLYIQKVIDRSQLGERSHAIFYLISANLHPLPVWLTW